MVTTDPEGSPPGEDQNFIITHDSPEIDYTTIHIWPQNWGWYDPMKPATYEEAEANARSYFKNHAAYASELGKPMVVEEFGLARDWEPEQNIHDPSSPTTYRDRFYDAMYAEVAASITSGVFAAGDNFWAWSGQARPGDAWTGDPPHEIPGWYSVYAIDELTLAVISAHAEELVSLQESD